MEPRNNLMVTIKKNEPGPQNIFFLKMNRVIAGYKFNKETTQVATTANALTNAIGDLKTEDIQIHDFFSYSCANICNNSSEKHISFIQENLNLSNHSNLSRINVLKTNGELNPREPLGPFTKPSLPFLTCLEKKNKFWTLCKFLLEYSLENETMSALLLNLIVAVNPITHHNLAAQSINN